MARFRISQDAARPAYLEGLFTAAQQAGMAPQVRRQREALSQLDPSTVQGLGGLATYYQGQGDMENATKYATAARNLQTQITEEANFNARKNSLANTATALQLPELAARVTGVSDSEELKTIAKEIRQIERDKMPTQTPLVRKRMANAAGISPELFDELGLAKVRDSVFNEYISGEKGGLSLI